MKPIAELYMGVAEIVHREAWETTNGEVVISIIGARQLMRLVRDALQRYPELSAELDTLAHDISVPPAADPAAPGDMSGNA